jgi:hypothetical protein
MISPDGHVRHLGNVRPGFLCELRLRAIFIKPCHGKPAIARDRLRIVHGDKAIGVARIADNQNAHVFCRILFDRLALADENLAVNAEQVLPFHPGFARNAAHEQRPIHIAESFVQIGRSDDIFQKGKRTIIQFHDHPFECLEAG